ncbi:MAG: S8 family serine peptidase [Gammaproteobacteria bacterium]|nr:S8 family serine peptidase [Gammaproteobacteria bacterium]
MGSKRAIADRIRYVGFNGVNPQEYFSYLGPVTYGHNSAAGANGVAAYAFFAPFVPEGFTSPGPSTIYFDKNNRRLRRPDIRQKPDMAAMDGANTTFFGGDSAVDADAFPNFFGTSAAAPHAAAIAALVLDAAGGPGKVKPKKMREILQDSAFRHDLDPYFSSGFALSLSGNVVAINAASDQAAIGQFDPNVFTVQQFGLRRLQSLRSTRAAATARRHRPAWCSILVAHRSRRRASRSWSAALRACWQPMSRARSRCLRMPRVCRVSGNSSTWPLRRGRLPAGICCPSGWIVTKPMWRARVALPAATRPICSVAACRSPRVSSCRAAPASSARSKGATGSGVSSTT